MTQMNTKAILVPSLPEPLMKGTAEESGVRPFLIRRLEKALEYLEMDSVVLKTVYYILIVINLTDLVKNSI